MRGDAVGVAARAEPRRRSGRLWLIVALVMTTLAALALHAWYGLRNHFFDLMVYRDAMLWWDDGNFLYDFGRPDATQGRLEFTYPPFAAYLLRPLAWLTANQSAVIFSAVSVAALAVSIWLLVRPVADEHGWPRWFTFGAAFVLASGLEPLRHTFDFGQINFIVWALVLVDLLVLLPRGSRLTGVAIGLATAIKLVPGVFILYLLATRRWRAGAMAAGTALLASALAAALAPRESWVFWTDRVLHGAGVGRMDYTFNQSLLGVLARLTAPEPPGQVAWLLIAVPALVLGLWRAARATARGDEVTGLTIAGLTGSLVSPVTWVHHIFWFVPALVVLTDAALRSADHKRRVLLLGYAALVYLTVTVSILSLWEFTWGQPGGALGFLLSNWFVWLMVSLVVALPVRGGGVAPADVASARRRSWSPWPGRSRSAAA